MLRSDPRPNAYLPPVSLDSGATRTTMTSDAPRSDPASHAADLALVARARAGDEAAVDEIVDRLGCVPAMLRERHRRFGGSLSADELAEVEQETLAALWGKLGRFEGRASIETWAFRFVVNEHFKAFERRRKRGRFVSESEGLLADRGAPAEAEPAIDAVTIESGLARVGEPGAEVIRLRHFEELSFEEIALRFREPTSTVKARYYRGLERLRVLLAPHWQRRNP